MCHATESLWSSGIIYRTYKIAKSSAVFCHCRLSGKLLAIDCCRLEAKVAAAEAEHAEVEALLRAALSASRQTEVQPFTTLVEGMRTVHRALSALVERCMILERQATSAAESSKGDREAAEQLKARLQAAAADKAAAAEEAGRERARAEALQSEAQAAGRRLGEAQRAAEEERQRAAQQHRQALADMAARMEAERAALRQEAATAAASAAAAAEDRGCAAAAAQLQEAQARGLTGISAARADAARAARELASLQQQFRAYQAVKAGEVAGLEARLRLVLGQPHGPGRPANPARKQTSAPSRNPAAAAPSQHMMGAEGISQACGAAAEVADAVQREAVAAAEREADLERLQRQAAETAAVEAKEAAEKLREKLQYCQRDLRSMQDRLAAATAERRQQPTAEFVRLQVPLVFLQK